MDWGAVAAIAAVGTIVGGGIIKLLDFAVRASKGESAAGTAKDAHTRIDALTRELGQFKTEVARDYASYRAIEQMEARLVIAINRLGDRLDKAFDRAAGKD